MENKKFKLNKDNLESIHLMQNMVFANIMTFDIMKNDNFDSTDVQELFNMRCDHYIRLHESNYTLNGWRSYYLDIPNPMISKYIIFPDKGKFAYHLIIEINKSYNTCSKLGIQSFDRLIPSSDPVLINIFNIQFELGD